MLHRQNTTQPPPIAVRVVDYGCEYLPESIGGREVSYLHADDGTVIRIAGKTWAYDLDVVAECWQGRIPHRDQRSITWMCKVRHPGSTHRQVVAWFRDELAGLHRSEVAA
jgi:hypothetical protein